MKNLILVFFAVCTLVLNIAPAQAQPNIYLTVKASEHSLSSDKKSIELKGKVENSEKFGYNFYAFFERTGVTTILRKSGGFTLFVDSSLNISIHDSVKKMNAQNFAYFVRVYSLERAKEIMRTNYAVYETSVISDTVTAGSGIVYLGDKNNPSVAKCYITSGSIIMTYTAETDEMSISINNVKIREESEDYNDIFPLVRLFKQ